MRLNTGQGPLDTWISKDLCLDVSNTFRSSSVERLFRASSNASVNAPSNVRVSNNADSSPLNLHSFLLFWMTLTLYLHKLSTALETRFIEGILLHTVLSDFIVNEYTLKVL